MTAVAQEPACSACGATGTEVRPDRGGDAVCLSCYAGWRPEDVARSLGAAAPSAQHPVNADRYGGRIVDLADVDADEQVPWRCDRLVADGHVTVLAGRGGHGKSWFALALAAAVHSGGEAAGIPCRKGHTLLVDAESGPKLLKRRMRDSGMPLDALTYCDADGLDLRNEHDVRWLERQVRAAKANLIVADSLARLCPGADEDRSKDMVPVMAALGRIARATNAGVLVVHHRGKGEGGYRGSSGIRDQCDALFVLDRSSEDRELRTIAVGNAGKFRLDVEPPPRAFRLGAVAGRVTINAADVPPPAPKPPTAAEKMRAQVVAVVAQQGDLTRAVIAEQVGVEPGDRTFKRALADAVELGLLAQPKRGTYREGPRWPSVIGGGPNGPSLPERDPRLC